MSRSSRRWMLLLLPIGILVAGVASYITTGTYWDGGFPHGEFRILVLDESGAPLPGAALQVRRHPSGQPAVAYPLMEVDQAGGMVSSNDGIIACRQPHDGFQFGGHSWELFWVIPIGPRGAPQYDLTFEKSGFQSHTMSIEEFFRRIGPPRDVVSRNTPHTRPQVAKDVLPVYKLAVLLKRTAS